MRLLFLCTHNRCRSVLGEAITRKLAAGRIAAASAGAHPAGEVHPLTLKYLQAAGYDTSNLASKGMDELQDFQPDAVITVCDSAAKEPCPIWLGDALKIHWGLPDPSKLDGDENETAQAFNGVINTIENLIGLLLEEPFEQASPQQLEALLNRVGAHR